MLNFVQFSKRFRVVVKLCCYDVPIFQNTVLKVGSRDLVPPLSWISNCALWCLRTSSSGYPYKLLVEIKMKYMTLSRKKARSKRFGFQPGNTINKKKENVQVEPESPRQEPNNEIIPVLTKTRSGSQNNEKRVFPVIFFVLFCFSTKKFLCIRIVCELNSNCALRPNKLRN